MEAADALLKLGVEFTDRGCYPQAAKCFLAVCGSQALPATIATARLLLGQVLLDHTHDVAQAKEHLTAAVRAATHRWPLLAPLPAAAVWSPPI